MSFYFSDLFVDTSSLPDDGYGFFQVLFLLAIYSAFIIYGSVLLIQGSELLVFVPSMSTIVGSVIVPLLGQMSDLVIVLFSCIGPNADEEFLIGVGSLAGSTIFIITILWFFSVMQGRVDYDEPSQALAYKRNPKLTSTIFQLRTYTGSGVSIDSFTKMTAVYMILTSLTYLIILFPNIVYANNDATIIGKDEKYYGLGAFIVGIVLLLAYLYLQFSQSNSQEENLTTDLRDELVVHTLQRRLVTLLGALAADIENRDSDSDSDADDYRLGMSRSMTFDEESAMHSSRRDASNPNSGRSPHNRSGQFSPVQHESSSQGNGRSVRHVYYGTHDNRNPERERGQQLEEHGSYHNLGMAAQEGESSRPLMRSSKVKRRLRRILRPFFLVYDFSHQGKIHSNDLHSVFHDFGENLPHQALVLLFDKYTDINGQITFRDFVEGTWEFLSHHDEILITLGRLQSTSNDDQGMELSNNALLRGHSIRDSHFDSSPVDTGDNNHPSASNNNGQQSQSQPQSRESRDRNNNRREVNFYTGLMFNLFGTREGESILPTDEHGNDNSNRSSGDGHNSGGNNNSSSSNNSNSGSAEGPNNGNITSGGDHGNNNNNNNNNTNNSDIDIGAKNLVSKMAMDDDDEMDPIPEDMHALTPEEQQEAIKWRAGIYLFFGTALLVFFMPPMIDAMLELSSRMGVSVFYVSFVVSPFIGDAPAYIVVYRYAQRKSRKSISITFNTLLGSVVVNNTLVLAVFMILIYTEGLEWDFLSETMAIFLVELVVGIYTIKNIHTLLDSLFILMLYPASLLLVYFLKNDSYT